MTKLLTISALAVLTACAPDVSSYTHAQRLYYAPAGTAEPAPVSAATAHHDAYLVTVQRALAAKGYYRGEVDGVCGPATTAAVEHYQPDLGVRPHGYCWIGAKGWAGLGLSEGDIAQPQASEPASAPAPHERRLILQ